MNNYLETAAKIAFWIFLLLVLWSILYGSWYYIFGLDEMEDVIEIFKIALNVTASVLIFLVGKAFAELSRMAGNGVSLLNRISSMAASVSAKASAAAKERTAAKEPTPNDSD